MGVNKNNPVASWRPALSTYLGNPRFKIKRNVIYIYIYILDSSAALRAASNLSTTAIIITIIKIVIVVFVTVSSIIISIDIIINLVRIFTVIAIVTVVIVAFNINLLLSHVYFSEGASARLWELVSLFFGTAVVIFF